PGTFGSAYHAVAQSDSAYLESSWRCGQSGSRAPGAGVISRVDANGTYRWLKFGNDAGWGYWPLLAFGQLIWHTDLLQSINPTSGATVTSVSFYAPFDYYGQILSDTTKIYVSEVFNNAGPGVMAAAYNWSPAGGASHAWSVNVFDVHS